MANILDYLEWRGDLTLAVSPFNEVDALLLAELSFINFEGIVPPPEIGRGVRLREAAERYFAHNAGKVIDMGVLAGQDSGHALRDGDEPAFWRHADQRI